MIRKSILLVLLLGGCAPIRSVTLESGLGHEERPSGRRDSAQVGVAVGVGSVKLKGKYRYRYEDGQIDNPEHGFFLGATIPIWKK